MQFLLDNPNVGKKVKYLDYLTFERFGTIVLLEPYKEDIYWVYIEDEDPSLNIHSMWVYGHEFKYAEMRLSDKIWLV